MSASGFLLDENMPVAIAIQMRRHAPHIPFLCIGEPQTPAKGTLDPAVLAWIEAHNYWLVTNNRASMPGHLFVHLQTGQHIPGILVVSSPLNIGDLIAELTLVWGASLPDEYQDQIVYLPLAR